MSFYENPAWLDKYNFVFDKYEDIPSEVFNNINSNLSKIQSNHPEVSIIISAWNEEINILKCVASLSDLNTKYPLEIIVVNNNSTDNTQLTIDRLKLKSLFQSIQGCGPSRQLAQENAKGKYILLADADCIYPEFWLDDMLAILKQRNVVCVYGRYSFISEDGFKRWKLAIYEKLKDCIAEFRHLNHPYFNAYGISMGYVKEYGLKVGFVMTKFWGDDGKMCKGLMEYGKVKQVKSNRARPWTSPRTLQRDGSFFEAFRNRFIKESKRFFRNFRKNP